MIRRGRGWLRSVLLRRRLEREMRHEMAEHLERSTDRLIARGLSPAEARREAEREFGNVAYLQEEGRIARGTTWIDGVVADLRFALRHFRRKPLSTLTIVLVLGIGIGINAVLFTMIHSFTERPPPGVEASDDLVRIRGSLIGFGGPVERSFSLEEVEAYRALDGHFSSVAAWTSSPVTASGPSGEIGTVTATFVSGDYFSLLGVRPALGPGLPIGPQGAGEERQVAVLSHGTWSRFFAEDPRVIGETIDLNDVSFTIVGVAPPEFRSASWEARDGLQVWVPQSTLVRIFPELSDEAELYRAVARLRPGVDREAATAAVEVVATRATESLERALGAEPSADVARLLADNNEPDFESEVRLLRLTFGVLGLLILLVTCTNASALQTGLALARRREIAIRLSLGASRARVVRQLLTESVLLSTLAGLAAVGVCLALLRTILWIIGVFSFDIVFDWPSALFTAGVALGAGLLLGLSPALHATRFAIAGAMKDSAATVAGARAKLQRSLVVAQIVFTQPLAVCVAATLVMGLADYRSNPPNPYGDRIVRVRLSSVGARQMVTTGDAQARERERAETERLLQRLEEMPGILRAVEFPNRVPFSRAGFAMVGPGEADIPADGAEGREENAFYLTGRAVTPGYLDVMGVPLVLGRDLAPADTAAFRADAVPAVIGDDMARSLWPGAYPLGRRVRSLVAAPNAGPSGGVEPITLEVVGVYDAVAERSGSSRDNFAVFLPPRPPGPNLVDLSTSRLLLIRTAAPAEPAMPAIRQLVREEAPRAAITEMFTIAAMEEEERFANWGGTALLTTGGVLALLLSALGLYAVVAFAVGQRTSEVAVRMAIGARARQIVASFASEGIRLSLIGLLIGLPLSVLGLRLLIQLEPELPSVSLPLVTAIVGAGVVVVALLASWIPATRAAEVDPAITLRRE